MPQSSVVQGILDAARRRAGGSQRVTDLAVRVRNQCQMVISHHLGDYGKEGEYKLLRVIGAELTTFVDVGANVGDWSQEALRAGLGARGMLFEPSPSAFARLRERFDDRQDVTLVQAAVGAAPGNAVLWEEPGAGQTASLVPGVSRSDATPQTVEVTTLDLTVPRAGIDQVDILKIDAEGYDMAVLKGAEQLLADHRIEIVQFEYNWSWAGAGATLGGALSYLEQFGMKTFLLRPAGLSPFSYAHYGEYFGLSNFVALSDNALQRHGDRLLAS